MKAMKSQMCPIGTEIQTLVFDKDEFSKSKSISWAKKHDFKFGKVDEKENTYRIRQNSPSGYEKDSFRTITLREGVKAVIGCPINFYKGGGRVKPMRGGKHIHKYSIGDKILTDIGEGVIEDYQISIYDNKEIPSYWVIYSKSVFPDLKSRNTWESSIIKKLNHGGELEEAPYVNQYFGKGFENEAIVELKKALPNHTFERNKNSIIVDGGKFIIHLDFGKYGFIRAYSHEGSEGGLSVMKLDEAISFIKTNSSYDKGNRVDFGGSIIRRNWHYSIGGF